MNTVRLIVYSVTDVPKAKTFFATLIGAQPYAESDYYIGFKAGDMEIGLLPPASQRGVSGALVYVDVSDIATALAALVAAGAEKVQDVTDVANGLLVAIVRDPDGTPIGLRQHPKP